MIENPTPGKGAATRGGNLIDANIPGPWGADHVKSYVIHTAGGHVMVLNVTTKDHTLKYGFVLRMVVNDGHGNYSILTYGEGNNWKQKDGGFFAWLGRAKKNEGTTWTESANKIEQEATRHRR